MWQCNREVGGASPPREVAGEKRNCMRFCLRHASDWMHVCSRQLGSCPWTSSRHKWCTGIDDSRQFGSNSTTRARALVVPPAPSVVSARGLDISDHHHRTPCAGVGGQGKCCGSTMRSSQARRVRPGSSSSRCAWRRCQRACHADEMPWSSTGVDRPGLPHGHSRPGHFP